MNEPIICHKELLFYMLGKKGRVHRVLEEMLVQAQSHTHTLSLKNHIVMAHTKLLLWDLYHHVLALDISTNPYLDG